MKKIFFLLFFLCFFSSNVDASLKKEEILFYHIDVTLNQDSSAKVQETITVRAQGIDIKRGIYKDIPLEYMNEKTPVKILDVKRNGLSVPFLVKRENGKKRVYMGDMNIKIPAGVYKYKITYEIQNIIRKNDKGDEFYYNLIGEEWNFDILKAQVVVRVPDGARLVGKPNVYTGKYGDKQRSAIIDVGKNQWDIHLINKLHKKEATTVRAFFDSGFFDVQGGGFYSKKVARIFFILIDCLLFVFAGFYAYFSWGKHGKDGIKKEVYPRFDVPKFKEFGAISLLLNYLQLSVSCCDLLMPHLAHLSQRGFLHVSNVGDAILLKKDGNVVPETADEKFFIERFEHSYLLKKEQYNHSFASYADEYKEWSKASAEELFKKNGNILFQFCFLMFLGCFLFFLIYINNFSNFPLAITLSAMVFGFSGIILDLKKKKDYSLIILKCLSVLFLGCFFLFFLGGFFISFGMLDEEYFYSSFNYILDFKVWFFVLLFSSFVAFYRYVIVRIYDKSLGLIEHLEGIKMFLIMTDDLKYKTPQQSEMEKLLPYAILLGIQNKWVEKMKTYFNFVPSNNDVFSDSESFSDISSVLYSSTSYTSGNASDNDGGDSSDDGCSGGGAGGGGGGGF